MHHQECGRSFDKIKDWNTHHRIMHCTKVRCTECKRVFVTPSSHRAHKNQHAPLKHRCHICKLGFAYISGLSQHKKAHTRSKLYRCFVGNCKKACKKDLTHHMQQHVSARWPCSDCDKVFLEERLLKRHGIKHTNIFKYFCTKCTCKSKWPTPFIHHACTHIKRN